MSSGTDTPLRALVVGESWIKHTVHVKGFDHFQTTEYEEGAHVFLDALRASNIDVTYIRAHEISRDFPTRAADLDTFDVVILSDVGSNSFLLTDETFLKSQRSINRLSLLADFVEAGGGLVMVGGYMSFTGIDGRARFNMSPLAPVLPVTMLDYDDRIETPEGFVVTVDAPDHPVLGDVIGEWPILLGYNRIAAKPDATVVASHGQDPILVLGTVGLGRSIAFASDVAPHWAPPEFLDWQHYGELWSGIVRWAAGREVDAATAGRHASSAAS
jgi:uncharacterized membrane protein